LHSDVKNCCLMLSVQASLFRKRLIASSHESRDNWNSALVQYISSRRKLAALTCVLHLEFSSALLPTEPVLINKRSVHARKQRYFKGSELSLKTKVYIASNWCKVKRKHNNFWGIQIYVCKFRHKTLFKYIVINA